ncbi:MAG: hypothetical protein D6696_20080, partial [Acidobacteria bacterium]
MQQATRIQEVSSPTYLRLLLTLEPTGDAPPARRPRLPAPRIRRLIGRALIARYCPFAAPRCQTGRPPATVA